MADDTVTIRKTQELDELKALCIRAGLDMQEGPLEGIVVAYGAYLGDQLVGCATLQSTGEGVFLEYVAVDPSLRKRRIGASLVAKIEEEARARGMKDLWAKARSPEFYRRIGFMVLGEGEKGPKSLDGCHGCPQFHTTCFPAVIVKRL